jgi:phosphohistidine swiveling domain-containing protein
MERDFSSMTVQELEKEVEGILGNQLNKNDLFRLAVFIGQMDLAKFIYHDKEYQPDTRHVRSSPKSGETAAYGQALIQLLLLMRSRGLEFGRVFQYAIEHMRDDEYKARKALEENGVNGYAVSGGSVSGMAYVVSRQTPLDKAPDNSIIVMEHADTEATEYLSKAKAVVTDQGGRLSHLAIMAREKGIPAVVGTGNATYVIKPGDRILVDADKGTVTRMDGD